MERKDILMFIMHENNGRNFLTCCLGLLGLALVKSLQKIDGMVRLYRLDEKPSLAWPNCLCILGDPSSLAQLDLLQGSLRGCFGVMVWRLKRMQNEKTRVINCCIAW